MNTLTPAEVQMELSQSKAALEAAGLRVTSLAYPYGIGDQYPEIVQLTSQYYRYGRAARPGYNQIPLSPYGLFAQVQTSSVSVETMKGWVDTAIATKRWLIICMHQVDDTGSAYSTPPAQLAELASYIKARVHAGSIQAVTVQQGFDIYTNSTPPCYPLTLSHTGQGSNPTASPTRSSACSTNRQYVSGETINLSGAVPSTGWQIGGWTGTASDGSTTATNSLVMRSSAQTVSVNYVQTEYSLTISSAHGTVTKNPNKTTYHHGESVQLTAAPAAGWSFANWTGDATGASNPVSVTMDGNKAVTANYTQFGYSLTIMSLYGTVTKNPDRAIYYYGDVIYLMVTPKPGWLFDSWSGDATGTDIQTSVTMDGNKSITARFVRSGTDTVGVFRPSNGLIYLKNQNTTGFADIALNYGIPGDKPVTGDWDNDGIDTIGVYRGNTFYLRNANTIGFAEIIFGFGNPGDMPIAGNWDGLP